MSAQMRLLPDEPRGRRVRLATRTDDSHFLHVTYFGRDGEVQYDELMGASLRPTGIEIYRASRGSVQAAAQVQHLRGISKQITFDRPPDEVVSYDGPGEFERLTKLNSQAMKREVGLVLARHFDVEFV